MSEVSVDVEKVIREYLPGVVHMSLATSKDGHPWVCEVHFAFDNDLNLYFRSTTARRHSQTITVNPRVAGNIVKQVGVGEPCQGEVCFEGMAKMLTPGPELDKAYESLNDRLGIGPEKLEEAKDPGGNQFYKITVEQWALFGNYDGQGLKKYTMEWRPGANA